MSIVGSGIELMSRDDAREGWRYCRDGDGDGDGDGGCGGDEATEMVAVVFSIFQISLFRSIHLHFIVPNQLESAIR